jgi:UDP-N-acetylmuramyl pentapeptide phosphotransferase/UDP-N-acetylglucosamine-1-phosphate transferase
LNRPPARIFMGDVGSTFLGFMLAAWSAIGTGRSPSVPLLASVAVLSPFLFDAIITLVRRLIRGEPISQAHRSHMYQRLVASGWTHGRTTALYGALSAFAGVLVIVSWCFTRFTTVLPLAALATPLIIPIALRRASRARNDGSAFSRTKS